MIARDAVERDTGRGRESLSVADRSPTRSRAAWVARVVLLVVVIPLCVYFYLTSPSGRQTIESAVSSIVSNQIAGDFEVRGIRSMWLPHLSAEELIVRDPDGREVLALSDIEVELDVLDSLRAGGFHAESATVGGGRILVETRSGDHTSLERAFAPRAPSQATAPRPDAEVDPTHLSRVLDVRRVTFSDIAVRLEVDQPRLDFHVARGRGRLWLVDGEDFQGRFGSIVAGFRSSESLIPRASLRGVTLRIDAGRPDLAHFSGTVTMNHGTSTVVGYAPLPQGGVRLCAWPGEDAHIFPLLIFETVLHLVDAVSLDVRPGELPAHPRCEPP